nr:hypothetical protein [Tanacetum cinerariifolium]
MDTGFELTAFLDSDYVGCLGSRKSTSGGIQFLGGDKLVSKETVLHFNVFSRSRAAIAISCNPVQHSRTKHIDVGYHFIKEQVEKGSHSHLVQSYPAFADKAHRHPLSLHQREGQKGIVELFFVGTEYQLADLFTKALPVERFQYLVRRLGMRCLTPAELEALANEPA